MAGEEDKKIKKKKSKKTSAAEEAPPAPAAEPEPEPVQEAAPGAEGAWPPAEGEGVWPPAGDDEPSPVDGHCTLRSLSSVAHSTVALSLQRSPLYSSVLSPA